MPEARVKTIIAKANRIALRLPNEDYNFLVSYAKENGISVSNAVRIAIQNMKSSQK